MIRYVLAVVLTVALVGIGWAGLERAAVIRSEQQVENQITRIDEAAVSLVDNDDAPPAGQGPPRRTVDLTFPHDGLTSESVDVLRIKPGPGNVSVVEYAFDGRASHAVTIDARIRAAGPTTVTDLSGETGTVTVVLSLREGQDGEYVHLRIPPDENRQEPTGATRRTSVQSDQFVRPFKYHRGTNPPQNNSA